MIKKLSLRNLCCGLAVSILMGGAAMASEYNGYVIYNLQANNSTNVHAKTTDYDNIENSLVEITGSIQTVDFWTETSGGTDLSYAYAFTPGVKAKMNFKSGVNKSVGDEIKMTMQNHNYTAHMGTVSGDVDFR